MDGYQERRTPSVSHKKNQNKGGNKSRRRWQKKHDERMWAQQRSERDRAQRVSKEETLRLTGEGTAGQQAVQR